MSIWDSIIKNGAGAPTQDTPILSPLPPTKTPISPNRGIWDEIIGAGLATQPSSPAVPQSIFLPFNFEFGSPLDTTTAMSTPAIIPKRQPAPREPMIGGVPVPARVETPAPTIQDILARKEEIKAVKPSKDQMLYDAYAPKIVKDAVNFLSEGLYGRGQEIDIIGNMHLDTGLIGFIRPFGIGKTDYERVDDRYNKLIEKGVTPERATYIAVQYARGIISDPLSSIKSDQARKKAIADLNLTSTEKSALRGVGFWEGLDQVLGALDFTGIGSIEKVAARQIAKETSKLTIKKILLKEIPNLTPEVADEAAKLLTKINDEDTVARFMNKLDFSVNKIKDAELLPTPKVTDVPIYEGESDLTTKVLQRLEGRDTVSKQFISDLTNAADLKQTEKDIVRGILDSYPESKYVPVAEFATKVKDELLPLRRDTIPDDTMNGDNMQKYEHVSLPDAERGDVSQYDEHIYQSPIKTSAGDIHFRDALGGAEGGYFGHVRTEDMADGSTRRIIEVQSDLYQKSNLEQEMTAGMTPSSDKEIASLLPEELRLEFKKILSDRQKGIRKDGQVQRLGELANIATDINAKKTRGKLLQYNNPTAHFRMVREEVRQAAIDGKTKLQFPTGETAMKIEGLGSRDVFNFRDTGRPIKIDELKAGEELYHGGQSWIITDVLGDGKFQAIAKESLVSRQNVKAFSGPDAAHMTILPDGSGAPKYLKETFDISGKVDTNNPIYRFYEKDLGRYLKNTYDAKLVTDKQGVRWYEVDIKPGSGKQAVTAFSRDLSGIFGRGNVKLYGDTTPKTGRERRGTGSLKNGEDTSSRSAKDSNGIPGKTRDTLPISDRPADVGKRGTVSARVQPLEEIKIKQSADIDRDLFSRGKISKKEFIDRSQKNAEALGLPDPSVKVLSEYLNALSDDLLKTFEGTGYVTKEEKLTAGQFVSTGKIWSFKINPDYFNTDKYLTGDIVRHEIAGHKTYIYSPESFRLSINSEVDAVTSDSTLKELFKNSEGEFLPTTYAYFIDEVNSIHKSLRQLVDVSMSSKILTELGLIKSNGEIPLLSKDSVLPYFEGTKDIWSKIKNIIQRDYKELWSEERWDNLAFERSTSLMRNEVMARYVERSKPSTQIVKTFAGTKIATVGKLATENPQLLFKDLDQKNVVIKLKSQEIPKKRLEPKVEGETPEQKIEAAKMVLKETETRMTPNEQKTIDGFNKSSGQETVGKIGTDEVVIGTFGKNAIERKIASGLSDRLPISEIEKTLSKITEKYKAGKSGFRKDNTVHVARMSDGERRAVITRMNAKGKQEIINFFKIGKNYYNFISNLKSFGIPTGTRTRMTSLEPKQSSPLTYEDSKTVSKQPEKVKVNVDSVVLKATKEDRLVEQKALKEIKKIQAKENLMESLKIKLPQNLQDKATELAIRKEAIDDNPMRALVKFMARRGEFAGRLPEVTGEIGKGKFARFGDRFISEATGIEDSEEARAAFEKYMATRKQFEKDIAAFKKDKKAFLDKSREVRNKIIENQKIGQAIERRERHISEILGDEATRKARIERIKQKELETQEKLKKLEEGRARYTKQVENAHLNEAQKKSLLAKFKTYLSPIAQTDKTTQKIYLDWESAKIKGKEDANKLYEKYAGHTQNEMPDIIEYEAGANTPWIRELFDDLFTQAKRADLPVDYKDNYIPHVYREKPEQIQKAIIEYMKKNKIDPEIINEYKKTGELPEKISVKLKIHPSFTRIRTFPDYKTAMEYGLTPRFRTVAEHAAYYVEEMGKTIANRKLIDELISEGKVLDGFDAPESWLEIRFPGRQFRTYYGPKDLADALNGQFRDEQNLTGIQTILKYGAKASRLAQEITLSAGIPGTNINFFSIGQTIKMLTVGVGELAKLNLTGASTSIKAAVAFLRSNFNKASIQFFKDNQKYVDLMAERNVSLGRRIGDYENNHRTWKQILTKDSLRDVGAALKTTARDIVGIRSFADAGKAAVNIIDSRLVGIPKDAFDKLFNEKTFNSFMPQMQLQVFKDMFIQATKAGMPEKEAADFAAETIKAEFGLINSLGRTKTTQDTLGTIFFAPKFREGIINVFASGAKSWSTQFRNAAYGRSRSFVIGMIVTFIAYNFLNRRLNDGKNMWDNEPGREFALRIPLPNGRIIYIEFMPSVLSFVRNMSSSVINFARGDSETALQKAGTLFSMPISLGTQIISNKDYFGRPIYDVVDTPYDKAKKAIQHLGLGVSHPYFRELVRYFNGKQDIYQTLVIATELPIKFSNEEKAAMSRYYEEKREKSELNARARKDISEIVDVYDEVQKLKTENNLTQAESIVDDLSDKEYEQYKMVMRYEEIQALRKNKQTDDAKTILNSLTEEEYLQYQAIKTIRSGEKRSETIKKKITGDKPEFYNGQQMSKDSFIESVVTYANAITTDPVTAFKRIFTGQRIRRVDNNTIIVERMSLAESLGIKKSQGYKSGDDLILDHTIPLQLGGDNGVDNLKLVPRATWASYTPVENKLGKLLRDEKITKEEAQRLINSFKNGSIPASDIMKL